MNEDMLNVMGSFISTELDAFENLHKELEEKDKEIEKLNNIIKEVIKYIKEHCIDDEFYINLSNKEKGIIDVLTILENGSDK